MVEYVRVCGVGSLGTRLHCRYKSNKDLTICPNPSPYTTHPHILHLTPQHIHVPPHTPHILHLTPNHTSLHTPLPTTHPHILHLIPTTPHVTPHHTPSHTPPPHLRCVVMLQHKRSPGWTPTRRRRLAETLGALKSAMCEWFALHGRSKSA